MSYYFHVDFNVMFVKLHYTHKKVNTDLAPCYENVCGTGMASALGGGVRLHAPTALHPKVKYLCPYKEQNTDSSASSPLTSHNTDSATPTAVKFRPNFYQSLTFRNVHSSSACPVTPTAHSSSACPVTPTTCGLRPSPKRPVEPSVTKNVKILHILIMCQKSAVLCQVTRV